MYIYHFRFYCPLDTVGEYIFIQKHGSEFLHVNYMQVLVRGNGCAGAQQVKSKSNSASDSSGNGLPDVGVEIQCDKCDAFFDNLSGPNVEFKIREDETKLVTGNPLKPNLILNSFGNNLVSFHRFS